MDHVVAHTDGSYRMPSKRGGWATVLTCGNEAILRYGSTEESTNNRNELRAALETLRSLNSPCRVTLHSDSRYVVNAVNKHLHRWSENGWKTQAGKPIANDDMWKEMHELSSTHKVKAVWEKGHSGNEGNELVDEFAQRAATISVS